MPLKVLDEGTFFQYSGRLSPFLYVRPYVGDDVRIVRNDRDVIRMVSQVWQWSARFDVIKCHQMSLWQPANNVIVTYT